MIYDQLNNWEIYKNISPSIAKALEYVFQTDFSNFEKGKYEIDGADIFAMINCYDTVPKEAGKWECHRKFIDIQIIFSGEEQIGFADINQMEAITEYSEEKDVMFLKGEGSFVKMIPNYFAVFFPQDAHKPNISINENPVKVKKVVVKIRVD